MKEDRKTFVAFSPLPLNKTVVRCFITLVRMLKIVSKKYDIVLVAKNKKQLKYYKESIGDDIKNIQYVLFDKCTYTVDNNGKTEVWYDCRKLQKDLKKQIKKCDIFYLFSSIGLIGMNTVKSMLKSLRDKEKLHLTFVSNAGRLFTIDLID